MKKLIATAAAALAAASMTVGATPALARDSHGYEYNSGHDRSRSYDYGRAGYDDHRYGEYDSRGRYVEPRRVSRNDHVWRGNDGRYYCERDNGTTGLIIGAAGGALLGRAVDTHGDRTLGTLIGGLLGGLLGQQIDKGDARCQ